MEETEDDDVYFFITNSFREIIEKVASPETITLKNFTLFENLGNCRVKCQGIS